MKKICLCCLALLCLTNLFAQETVNYKEKKPYKTSGSSTRAKGGTSTRAYSSSRRYQITQQL